MWWWQKAHWGNFVNSFYIQKQNALNQVRTWFLKIDPVWIIVMRVCAFAPEAINN